MAFVDDMRIQGHAVESTCRVLPEHGCQVAARTCRSWRRTDRPVADRVRSDTVLTDVLLSTAGTPEGLYGCRKMAHCPPRRGPAGPRLHRTSTRPALGRRLHYCRTWAGFVYVAFVVDVFAQRIVGWHASTDKRTDLVLIPVRIALWDRGRQGQPIRPSQLTHHCDAGSQYTSIRITEHLDLEGIAPSIGSVGDAYDCETVDCLQAA